MTFARPAARWLVAVCLGAGASIAEAAGLPRLEILTAQAPYVQGDPVWVGVRLVNVGDAPLVVEQLGGSVRLRVFAPDGSPVTPAVRSASGIRGRYFLTLAPGVGTTHGEGLALTHPFAEVGQYRVEAFYSSELTPHTPPEVRDGAHLWVGERSADATIRIVAPLTEADRAIHEAYLNPTGAVEASWRGCSQALKAYPESPLWGYTFVHWFAGPSSPVEDTEWFIASTPDSIYRDSARLSLAGMEAVEGRHDRARGLLDAIRSPLLADDVAALRARLGYDVPAPR